MIFAIDPGPEKSGWAIYNPSTCALMRAGVDVNTNLKSMLQRHRSDYPGGLLAVEMMAASYGTKVGASVFETCVWIGRFIENYGGTYRLIYRHEVLKYLTKPGFYRHDDVGVRQALLDRFPGGTGTAKAPGPLYGVTSHAWPALGVAVTAAHKLECSQ